MALTDFLKGIADAIREKKGTTETINAQDFADEIRGLSAGGGGGRTALSMLADMSITEVTEQDLQGATFLRDNLFYNVQTLSIATIPNTVKYTLANVFAYCKGLTKAVFKGDLEVASGNVIESRIFWNCDNVKKIIFEGNIKGAINYGIFQNCYNLEVVDMSHCTNIPTITGGETHFENVGTKVSGGTKVIIPDSLYDDWRLATNWVSFTNITYVKASEYTEA